MNTPHSLYAGAISGRLLAGCVLVALAGAALPAHAAETADHALAALAANRAAVARAPRSPEAHKDLGNSLVAAGQYKAAVAQFQAALRLDPKYAKAYHNLGRALYYEGDLPGSVRAYQHAIRLQPIYPMVEWQLGMTYEAQGSLEQAVGAYGRAVREQPDKVEYRTSLAVAQATLADKEGRYAEAIAAMKAWCALDPDDMARVSDLGLEYRKSGQEEKAWEIVSQALAAAPDCPNSNRAMALLCEDKGEHEAALRYARHAVDEAPGWRLAARTLADLQATSKSSP